MKGPITQRLLNNTSPFRSRTHKILNSMELVSYESRRVITELSQPF